MKIFKTLRGIALLLVMISIQTLLHAQTDTVRRDLRFDPGFARGGQINLWPVFKKAKNTKQSELQILFPFFAKKTVFCPREKHTRILPIYFSDSTTDGTDRRILSLYYPSLLHIEKKDSGINQSSSFKFLELAPGISGIQMSRSHGGLSVQNNLLFLLWYKRDSVRQRSHLVFFPLYWHYVNPSDTTSLLFLLSYRNKSATRKQTNIALLYSHSKGSNWSKTTLFPIFYTQTHFLNQDTSTSILIFPVFLSAKNNLKNTKIVFPVYFYHKNKQSQSTTIFPFFSTGNSDTGLKKHLHIFPLYWSFENPYRQCKIFAPLIYYNKKENKKSFSVYPLFRTVSADSNRYRKLSLLTLFNHISTPTYSKTNIYPLIYTGKKTIQTDTIRYRIFIPFYFSKTDKTINNKIVLPLFYHLKNTKYQSTTLLPFYSAGHSSNDSISHLHIFPFYWSSKKTDGKFQAFVPLYFHRKTLEKKYSTVLPFFTSITYDSGRSRQFHVFPLYYSVNEPREKQRVIFPFWWHTFSTGLKGDTTLKNTFFPIYYKGKSPHRTYLSIFPLYFSSSDVQKQFQCLFPIYLHHYDKWTQYDMKVYTPLFWRWKYSDENKHTYLFPLYWAKKTVEGTDTTIRRTFFPIFHYSKTSYHENYYVFPLLFRFCNSRYHSLTLFPLFSTGRSSDGKSNHLTITPLLWVNHTAKKKSMVLFPLWWQKKLYQNGDTISKTALFPIFRSARSNEMNNQSVLFLYYHNDNKKRHTLSIWPFYSQGYRKDKEKTFFSITPFYWHIKKEKISRDFLFPVLWYSVKYRHDNTAFRTTLFPIYWNYRDSFKQKTLIIPFLYRFKNFNNTSITLFPFFTTGRSNINNTSYLFSLPIIWKFKNESKERTIVFPFWWDFTDYGKNDTLKRKVLFPLVSYSRNKDYSSGRIFPFVYWTKEKDQHRFGLIPLYFSGSNQSAKTAYRVFSLLLWKFYSPEKQQTVLFPLLWNNKGTNEQNPYVKTTLFPFLWYRQNNDRKSFMVCPLAYYSKAPGRERLGLFPLIWHSKGIYRDDTLSTHMITPLYWSFKRDHYRFRILVPLFLQTKNDNLQTTSVFPLFSIGNSHDNKSGFRIITPIAGYIFNPAIKHFYLFPLLNIKKSDSLKTQSFLYFLYRREKSTKYSRTSAIWPLIESYRSEGRKSFRIAPFIWYHKTDSSQMFSFQPIQYSYKSVQRKEFRLLWHLYRSERVKGESVSRSVLWKVFEHEKTKNGEFETRFLYLVYANINKSGRREFSLLPFYHTVSNDMGEKNTSVFFSFYSYVKRSLPDVNDFYEEERLFWLVRVRSNYDRLKNEGKEKSIKRR